MLDIRLAREFQTWGFDRRGWAKTTRRLYTRRIAAFERHLGRSSIRASPEDCWGWMTTLPATAGSRNVARNALLGWFGFLIDIRRRADNPAATIPVLPEHPPPPKALSGVEATRVLTAASSEGPMWSAVVSILLHQGLRATEMRLLSWGALSDGWVEFLAKGGQRRVVPLHDHSRRALGHWRSMCPDPQWILPSPTRRHLAASETYLRVGIRQIGDHAGITGLHPHVLRHTFATSLVESGVDVRMVQELMGHASLRTTQRYLKVRPSRLVEAVASLQFEASVAAIDLTTEVA